MDGWMDDAWVGAAGCEIKARKVMLAEGENLEEGWKVLCGGIAINRWREKLLRREYAEKRGTVQGYFRKSTSKSVDNDESGCQSKKRG